MRRRARVLIGSGAVWLALSSNARAADVGTIDGTPVRVDISETSVLKYHFDNRNDKGQADIEHRIDDNYGEWLNRFNETAGWKNWQGGLRFDTATYFHRPDPNSFENPTLRRNADNTLGYQYRSVYAVEGNPCLAHGDNDAGKYCLYAPSKLYVTYATPDFEATVGDAYGSLGRGMVLSLRKLDELAADTSIQGGKVVARLRPFTFTAIVGLSNPVRIDEATGIALRDPDPNRTTVDGAVPGVNTSWSRDLLAGGRVDAKIGSSTLGVQAADIHRRADLGFTGDPTIESRDILNGGASIAIPQVSKALPLNAYLEIAMQNRSRFSELPAANENKGYAAYGSLSLTEGIVTTTLEGKHYRGYYPARVYADPTRYGAFRAVQYMTVPTLEMVTQDSLFDNSCTSGSRARIDFHVTKSLLSFVSAAYFANWGERDANECNIGPGFGVTHPSPGVTPTGVRSNPRNDIWDGYVGFELRSQKDASYVTLTLGVRRDNASDTGNSYYREGWVQGDIVKMLSELWSIELSGWHRNRFESDGVNLAASESWREGETYFAIKNASKRSFIIGHEYTTRALYVKPHAFLASESVQHFVNFGAQFRFSDSVMLRLFVGQQRGALKCVSGICRQFPNFEGAKSELVVTY